MHLTDPVADPVTDPVADPRVSRGVGARVTADSLPGVMTLSMRAVSLRHNFSTRRRVVAAIGATVAAAIVTGVPTSLIVNPWFARMSPPTWWSYPVWVVSSILMGLLAATYVKDPGGAADPSDQTGAQQSDPVRSATGGGVLTTLAVGCPTCNKVAVLALGTSGATTFWAPLQPIVAVASIALLLWALDRRLRPITCAVPVGSPSRR